MSYGLLCALSWGISTLLAAVAARRIGALRTLVVGETAGLAGYLTLFALGHFSLHGVGSTAWLLVLAGVIAVPGLAHRGPQIAAAVQSGKIGSVIGTLPGSARQAVGTITRTAFTTGLNGILLVAAVIALASGVVSLASIRGKDFAQQRAAGGDR